VALPPVAEPLLALPPSRFVAGRDALAKALAEKGDAAAAAVRKVPRPLGLAWVLNRLARERPGEVRALLAAGDRLRAGQRRALSGAGGGELHAAEDELRARARTLRAYAERVLAGTGRPAAPAALARIELLLRATAPQLGPVRDALARGVLPREPEVASGELGGFGAVGGRDAHEGPARDGRAEREARAREERARRGRRRQVERLGRDERAARARAARAERVAAEAAERARVAVGLAARARGEADRLAERLRELRGGP
jgi:hypothetical protein